MTESSDKQHEQAQIDLNIYLKELEKYLPPVRATSKTIGYIKYDWNREEQELDKLYNEKKTFSWEEIKKKYGKTKCG